MHTKNGFYAKSESDVYFKSVKKRHACLKNVNLTLFCANWIKKRIDILCFTVENSFFPVEVNVVMLYNGFIPLKNNHLILHTEDFYSEYYIGGQYNA